MSELTIKLWFLCSEIYVRTKIQTCTIFDVNNRLVAV